MIHEDDRRSLEDFPEGKLITANSDCVIGNHYHKVKTELFYLIMGEIEMTLNGESFPMQHGVCYKVSPLDHHSFKLKVYSQMIGLCSHIYDPTDDYKK